MMENNCFPPAQHTAPAHVQHIAQPHKAALVWSPTPDPAHVAKPSPSTPPSGNPANPSQGLVHWMSVMAEHMNNPHHDVHYMWNGVEAKMNSEQQNTSTMQKGEKRCQSPGNMQEQLPSYRPSHLGYFKGSQLEEGRMDSVGVHQIMPPSLYNAQRSNSSSSSSPPVVTSAGTPAAGSMLVVPQPINAAKVSPGGSLPQPPTTNGTGRKYQCKMCPQIFGSKADLQLHTQIHMREAKPYKCSQCSKAFANSSYLSQHTRIHLGIKPYRCEICQRKFTQLSHLQQHIRTHTGDKPYKCRHPGCNKAFSQLSNLQSHSRCHQTDKPYKCNSCYKCFSDEPSLLEHIPKHKESKHLKTHICQYCGKSYTQETYLTKHMQKHAERTDKRPPITGVSLRPDNPYWPKTDSNHDGLIHDRVSEACLQSGLSHISEHSRIPMREHIDHRMMGVEDLRHSTSHLPPTQVPYESIPTSKTTSAFTPIQSTMLPISTASQFSMPSSSRSYFPYESLSFPKTPSQVPGMEMKPASNSFPNQLISLHQIRNYAHQPTSDHLLKGLQEKVSQ